MDFNINTTKLISFVHRHILLTLALVVIINITHFGNFLSFSLFVDSNFLVTIPSIDKSEVQPILSSPRLLQESQPIKNYQGNIDKNEGLNFSIQSNRYHNHDHYNITVNINKHVQRYDYKLNETGSLANCTTNGTNLDTSTLLQIQQQYQQSHPDSDTVIASCHQIHYRVPRSSFYNVPSVIFGVLSMANGEGPVRRQSIRDTWGRDMRGVFFLVAGPWEDIKKEYERYGDLLWVDEEEVYDGERSVLTWKTLTFASVVHRFIGNTLSQRAQLRGGGGGGSESTGFSHCFKTDDDTYINVENLYRSLYNASEPHVDYWGWCQDKKYPPNRDDGKWSVSNRTYPEALFPRYCQGAGYALSRNFLECAVNHVAQIRFMPFEDVTVGMLAERCGITPTKVKRRRMIRLYRTNKKQERKFVKYHLGKVERRRIPGADMAGRVLQHRIYDVEDMFENHRTVWDPDFVPPKRKQWLAKVALREKEKEAKREGGDGGEADVDDDNSSVDSD